MIFEIKTRDENGDVAGDFRLNREEATFVLNIGLNYLAVNGAIPLFTGKEDGELAIHATPQQTQ